MRRLNNKGMTVVELLASFIIVALIITSLYATMNNFSDKRVEESAKESIYAYKNVLTKEIYDDIIIKGLINVETSDVTDTVTEAFSKYNSTTNKTCISNNALLTRVRFTFKDTTQKYLIVAKGSDGDIVAYGAMNDLHIYDLPKYDDNALRIGNVESRLTYPNYNFEMRFEHPLFSQRYGVIIRAIINIDTFDN